MTGFEYAQTCKSMDEKILVLLLDATKLAYHMAGMDFDSLPLDEKEAVMMKQVEKYIG